MELNDEDEEKDLVGGREGGIQTVDLDQKQTIDKINETN